MFTGIIQGIGEIKNISKKTGNVEIEISCTDFFKDQKIGASIAVDGTCLTIIELTDNSAKFDVMQETLDNSTLEALTEKQKVNLEPAVKANERLEGHIVQGHIDTVAEIQSVQKEETQTKIQISYPKEGRPYLALKGSITVDGISLTISLLDTDKFEVSLVKHTLENTNLGHKAKGSKVNIEFDSIAKYIKSILDSKDEELKYSYLKERGFI